MTAGAPADLIQGNSFTEPCMGMCSGSISTEEAVQTYTRSLELSSDDTDSWLHLGMSLYNPERYDEVVGACDLALDISPDDADVWNIRGDVVIRPKCLLILAPQPRKNVFISNI